MAYMKRDKNIQVEEANFLKSNKLISYTTTVKKDDADQDGEVKAGTIYPANDGTAEGILYNTVDVSHGDQPASLIVTGHVLAERLPESPTAEAIQALDQIKFFDGEGKEFSPEA